jgi:Zn-finger nucleic acid-binding protein
MNCPNCAAAMSVVGNRGHLSCDYCGTLQFPTDVGDGVRPIGDMTNIPCPVCHIPLEWALIETAKVAFCSSCRGFLANNESFVEIVHKRRAKHAPHERITAQFDPKELNRILSCPGCRGRFETHPYFGGGNAVVDTCAICKLIWLDAGELAIIERHVTDSRPDAVPIYVPIGCRPPPDPDEFPMHSGGFFLGGILGTMIAGLSDCRDDDPWSFDDSL